VKLSSLTIQHKLVNKGIQIQPEYDFSGGVRGKYAKVLKEKG
jgi:hypothetical protein